MRFPLLLTLLLLIASVPITMVPTAAAQSVCAPSNVLCAGEAQQFCGGPAPYGDGWDGFTGVWGDAGGVEYGVGGWDRCYPGYWSAGAFVNMDQWPAGSYQNAQVRFDNSPASARPCYLSAGIYGWQTRSHAYGCPDEDEMYIPIPNPGWGNVLP